MEANLEGVYGLDWIKTIFLHNNNRFLYYKSNFFY
jgi:hypothetical protein